MNTASVACRASGVLLHPTSLPGPHGVGTLGEEARRFIRFLVAAQQSYWQILPLGPTGFGDSPYSTFCSVAGNPLLIDLPELVKDGDLAAEDPMKPPESRSDQVDFCNLIPWKLELLERAARRFIKYASGERRSDFHDFCSQHAVWIDHYALFMAIKDHFEVRATAEGHWNTTWNNYWDHDIAMREPAALKHWRERVAEKVEIHRVWQYYFYRQWLALRRYANERGIQIIGDMPIFIASDSADVWVVPELFRLDEQRRATLVAGVPPDYFSATGQRWGNPLYDWDAMATHNFAWWILRFRSLLELVDIVRIDHFRGFESCWAIPADEETAVNGHWIEAPGYALFEKVRQSLGDAPILAEDLGLITPAVEALRDHFGFPGMRLLQVGLENIQPDNIHLPENHDQNCVVYTGTHDNNTALGWYDELTDDQQAAISEYLHQPLQDPAWDLMRLTMNSRADTAIIPMQDALRLGSSARLNTPGTSDGNWRWRMRGEDVNPSLADELARLTAETGRCAS